MTDSLPSFYSETDSSDVETLQIAANLHSKRWDTQCSEKLQKTTESHLACQRLMFMMPYLEKNWTSMASLEGLTKSNLFSGHVYHVSYIMPWYTKHQTFKKAVLSTLRNCILKVLFTNIRLVVSFPKQPCQHYKVAQVIFFFFKAWRKIIKILNG